MCVIDHIRGPKLVAYWYVLPHTVCLNTRDSICKWAVSHKNPDFQLLLKTWTSQQHPATSPHGSNLLQSVAAVPFPGMCSPVCHSSYHWAALSPSARTPARLPQAAYLPAPAGVWVRNCSTFPNILGSSNSSPRRRYCQPHSMAMSGSSLGRVGIKIVAPDT